ncbi:HDOD domain-containing protein [Hydrogenophilus thermoluteolus]|nr:HDOD domain-containing protein [Hydrogenophilus thermoluteolus]MBW7656352.1 HDOD domain-containing protein [Hydrogenophilus thermoluteolus]
MNTAFAYLTREPALNRRFQITANRLCLHASTTEQALQTLTALTPHWPQSHAVLLSLMRLPPSIKLLSWAWPENTFLEIPQQALTIPATQQLIAHCVQQETPLCLAWYDGVSPYPDAPWRFSLVDWRKCQSPDAAPGVALAWGVPSRAAAQTALHHFAGVCGWFFLKEALPNTQCEPAPARTTVLHLIALLQQDAEIAELEKVLKRDVALGYRLLRYLNSPAMGLRMEITSFRHAVSILGYRPLLRWLSVLLVHSHDHPEMPALAQTALTRARYLERLAAEFFDADEAEALFLCGLFSILPQLTGEPPEVSLEPLTLPEAVKAALIQRDGPYAPLLALAEASESASPARLIAQAESLGVASAMHNQALLEALEFADQINQ